MHILSLMPRLYMATLYMYMYLINGSLLPLQDLLTCS